MKAKAAGQLSSAHQTSTMNVGLDEGLTESQVFKPFVSDNAGWRRIISYYKPWYANIGIGVLSILNTFQWIAVGVFVTLLMVVFTAFTASNESAAGTS